MDKWLFVFMDVNPALPDLHIRVYLPSLGKAEERIGKRVAGRFPVLTALTLLVRRGRSCVISSCLD